MSATEREERQQLSAEVREARAKGAGYAGEMQQRRNKRLAALLLADALDLTEDVPIPAAFTHNGGSEYVGTYDGVRYRVRLDPVRIFDHEMGQPRNPELGPLPRLIDLKTEAEK